MIAGVTTCTFALETVEPRHAFSLVCENIGADQLCSNCFHDTDSYITTVYLPESGI